MAATNKDKIVKDIKTGGSMIIYVGTASIVRPMIKQYDQNRNPITRLCSVISGTIISCGVSHMASQWFGKIVDNVADFIDDVKNPKKKEEGDTNAKQQ